MRLVGYCRLSIKQQEPTFKLSHKSREMKMNWLFEAYSNVYNTAMGQRPFHHEPRGLTADQKRVFERVRVKNDV
jgi:hypothetical protein